MKAYGYIRVSGDSQSEGDGPVRQKDKITKAASKLGITIIEFFFDDGVKGKTETLDRPAFSQMWSMLSPDVPIVIFEKLDRLSRDLYVQESAVRNARMMGYTLMGADEGDVMASNRDSKDVQRKLQRQIQGIMAEYDKDNIVLRLREARMRVKAPTGRCEGQKPYADTLDGRTALDRIVSLRASGMGYDKIASNLNAEGVPTKRPGTIWHGSTVNKMLSPE
jgi:DNA invertase Pin-like site-specific DNA recombinase